MRELTKNLKATEEVVSILNEQLENLMKEKLLLQNKLKDVQQELVLKENSYNIHTHERDALLRELSQQLYDARNAIASLERRVGLSTRGSGKESPHSRKTVVAYK